MIPDRRAAIERVGAIAKAVVDPLTIPWDDTVTFSLFGSMLSVHREDMTLHDAVRRFQEVPEERQGATTISMRKPYVTTLYGRPITLGFLDYLVIREMARVLKDGGTRHGGG